MNLIHAIMSIFGKPGGEPRCTSILDEPRSEEKIKPFFDKPKVLLIDSSEDCFVALIEAGLNVQQGTFGNPYHIDTEREWQFIVDRSNLPNHSEQEIIIIDLTKPAERNLKSEEIRAVSRSSILYAKPDTLILDPRALGMVNARGVFDRILRNGGVFIIFAQPREFISVKQSNSYATEPIDNWSFLSVLDEFNLRISKEHGFEMFIETKDKVLSSLIASNLVDAEYTAGLQTAMNLRDTESVLLKSKFQQNVGLLICPDRGGTIIILPQIKSKAKLLKDLFTSVLPNISPQFFPGFEAAKWTERPEYALPGISERLKQIDLLNVETNTKIQALLDEISAVKAQQGYKHELLTGTGDVLVRAVKRALEEIGFRSVVEIDVESQTNLQEDLQIQDCGPLVVVEVKGLSNVPKEDDTSQVVKYINRRMRELNRTDVRGLVVINHQRHIPPLERNNENCFTAAQIEDAKAADVTLVSSWDIYRMLHGLVRNQWSDTSVLQKLFYENGRLSPIPKHYELVGTVEKTAPNNSVIGLRLVAEELATGETIAFISDTEYVEFKIDSMELNKAAVQSARKGDLVGIKVSSDIKVKKSIWRVKEQV